MSLHFVRESPDLQIATLIASSGFIQPVSNALQLDVDMHLKEGQMVYSIFKDDALVGFAIFNKIIVSSNDRDGTSSTSAEMSILYLAGIMLHESVQGQGIAEYVVQHVRKIEGLSHLALRTQSLRMWCAGNKMTDVWYPNPSRQVSESYAVAVVSLAKGINMSLTDLFSSSGFYGAPLYGKKPIHRNGELQMWWDSICSFERGDAVLCIGRFKD